MNLLNGLKRLFSWDSQRVKALRKSPFEPYASIIESALLKRGTQAGDRQINPVHKQPEYLVRLCNVLASKIQAAGNPSVTLEDVLRVERSACGHSDYEHKFAFYCADLAEKGAVKSA
ncbi:hypothetical protein V0M98_33915 (plasmid) [Pseudomonas silesiensis]|uniref:hypothetical protein n=1 Tax=Pseudomonas silesiensis TaxID=1853130 RepID=UPI0030CA6BDC